MMSNYHSTDNHDDNDNSEPQPPQSSVGAVSNLLGLFDPPPLPPPSAPSSTTTATSTTNFQPKNHPPPQIPSSVAKTPISSGRRTSYNSGTQYSEQIPLLPQPQQQLHLHSTSMTTTTGWEDSAATTSIPLLSGQDDDDDDEKEFDSIMTTPKQQRHPVTTSYNQNNNNRNSNTIQSLDHRSRIDSISEILPPIHEMSTLNDDIPPVPPAPMTPISTWLSNNYNNNNDINHHHASPHPPQHHTHADRLMTPELVVLDHHHPASSEKPSSSSSLRRSVNHYKLEAVDTNTNTTTTRSVGPWSWWHPWIATIRSDMTSPSTYIGAFLFLLFELVFSLTIGATITRSSSLGGGRSMLGLVTKIATLGTILGGPVYWFNLRDVPALYPVVDLFAAPFLANIATIIDDTLCQDPNVSDVDSDEIFITTFSLLSGISLFISGCFMVLASMFKLANLGSFLPFPVLCGFFTAAACMTWTLAFKVDTNGLTVSHVIFSGDARLIVMSLVHHIPSVLVGATMKYLGPKHPLFVLMSVVATIGLFYSTMFLFGISFQEMIDMHWFWSESDLHYEPPNGAKVRTFNLHLRASSI